MVETSFYDVVVCGHELGGLLTAALLGRRGFRVLLLGHDAHPLSFDLGAFPLVRGAGALPALDSPAIARVLNDLSLVQVIRRRVRATRTDPEICAGGRRFSLAGDDARLAHEIESFWPDEAASVRDALAHLTATGARVAQLLAAGVSLPPGGFWERREWGRIEASLPRPGADLFAPLPAGHLFRAVAAQPAVADSSLGRGTAAAVGAVTLANAFVENRRGLCFVNGGEAGIWRLLLDKLETFSGERQSRAWPAEIVMRGGRATGVRIRPRDETLGCAALVWAGSSRGLLSLLGERAPRKARELSDRLRPAYHRYGLSMWLRAGALTDGAPMRRFLVEGGARPPTEESAIAFSVGASEPRHAQAAPAWAECLIPVAATSSGAGSAGYFAALRGRMRARLAAAVPGFERDLLCLGSFHDGLAAEVLPASVVPTEPVDARASAGGSAIPAQPMPIVYAHDGDQPTPFDALGTPPTLPGLRNVFLVGRENLPGLGVSGEFAAAWNVTRLLSSCLRTPRAARQGLLVRQS